MTSKKKKYIIALDQGTTSCRALVFDDQGSKVGLAQKEFTQYYPHPGWVEHDAEEIWSAQLDVLYKAIASAKITSSEITALGITNQRETSVLWDRKTAKPVAPAIVWQCRRTAAICQDLKDSGKSKLIKSITGLVPDAYFSATKWQWMLENDDNLRQRAENGELLAGTIDSWLIYKLTAGRKHVTDISNASRTMLMDLAKGQWDSQMLELFKLPPRILPQIVASSGIVDYVDESILAGRIPIAGIAGDQQAALFGQGCFQTGMIKNTYGTGCFILMQTQDEIIQSENGLLTTVAWQIDGKISYALEGSVFNAGSAISWLKNELGIIKHAYECDQLAARVGDTGGVCFVPAFTGLGAPWWDMAARGTIVGLTRGSTKEHLARAVLTAIAMQSNEVISLMSEESKQAIPLIRVDGGASVSDLLMQMQADYSRVPVERPQETETTALGAAGLAGLAVGVFSDLEEFAAIKKIEKLFTPKLAPKLVEEQLRLWQAAVDTTIYSGQKLSER